MKKEGAPKEVSKKSAKGAKIERRLPPYTSHLLKRWVSPDPESERPLRKGKSSRLPANKGGERRGPPVFRYGAGTWDDCQLIPSSAEQLADILQGWSKHGLGCFRGQSFLAPLLPSIARERAGTAEADARLEAAMLSDFREDSYSLLRADEREVAKTVLGTMLILQHHGGATALLDWTESPWVAAYFAASRGHEQPGGVWCSLQLDWDLLGVQPVPSDVDTLMSEQDLGKWKMRVRNDSRWILMFRPGLKTTRMIAQQSLFSIANPIGMDHGMQMKACIKRDMRALIVIKPEIKRDVIKMLRHMNVQPATLFPGLEGLCRKLGEDCSHALR